MPIVRPLGTMMPEFTTHDQLLLALHRQSCRITDAAMTLVRSFPLERSRAVSFAALYFSDDEEYDSAMTYERCVFISCMLGLRKLSPIEAIMGRFLYDDREQTFAVAAMDPVCHKQASYVFEYNFAFGERLLSVRSVTDERIMWSKSTYVFAKK